MDPGFGAASRRSYGRARLFLGVVALLLTSTASAQTPITLFRNFVGHVNYQATGGSLRNSPNTGNSCSLAASSTSTLSGLPAGASLSAAYLYWAGSGSTADNTVTLNGTTVTASRTFNDTFSLSGTDYDFFSGFANVTNLIGGNGNVTFSGLTVNSGATYCNVQAVLSGWALIVVYAHPAEDLRAVNVFDGFQLFRASALTLTVDNFRIPPSPVNGKVTHITWEGDPQNSGPLGGFAESLTFNGGILDDGLNPPGSSPLIQQFDGTVNSLGLMTTHGVDVDTYNVSAFLTPGDMSASTTYSSGGDLVLLSAEVISFTTEPVVDLEITKSHPGDFNAGTIDDYMIRVRNSGPEREVNSIVVTDTLPNGMSFVSFAGSGWTCGAAGAAVTCMHPGPIDVGATLPDLTLSVLVSPSAPSNVTNTASVSSASVDNTPGNNSSTISNAVLGSQAPSSGTKTLYLYGTASLDPNGFNQGSRPYLSRTPPTSNQTDVDLDRNAAPVTWRLTPALQAPLTIAAGTVPVTLYLSKNANGGAPAIRTLRVDLATTGAVTGPLGAPVTLTFAAPGATTPTPIMFSVPLPSATTLPTGTQITLTLTNVTPGGGTRRIRLFPTSGSNYSRVEMPALTVINVDSASSFSAPYPGGSVQAVFVPGATVALRADVRDPFGRFDIAAVTIDIREPGGASVVTGQNMAPVQTLSGAAATYQYVFTIPSAGAPGDWSYRVTGIEGVEASVTHALTATFSVLQPNLLVTKSVSALVDPVNGTVNPKAVPGAIMLYTLSVANNGALPIDANSLTLIDRLPAGTALYVGTGGGDPIVFVDGSPASGLVFDYATNVAYSNRPGGGAPYTYSPTPDGSGFDAAITGVRINPQGSLGVDSGTGAPAFELRYRMRID